MNQIGRTTVLRVAATTVLTFAFSGVAHSQQLISPDAIFQTQPDPKLPEGLQWGEQVEGFKLAIHVNRTRFGMGDRIMLSCYLKNQAFEVVTLWEEKSPLSGYQLSVTSPTGLPPAFTPSGRTLIGRGMRMTGHTTRTLTAAETDHFEIRRPLNELYEMTTPGEYEIVAKRKLPKRDHPNETVEITSNKLRVHLTRE